MYLLRIQEGRGSKMKAAQHTKYHKENITVTITEIEKPKISSE